MNATALLLSCTEVERLLTPDACIAAVDDAFRRHALGEIPAPGILGMHVEDGSFHVKAACIALDRRYFAAKLNANFPANGLRHGLPTIQGVLVLSDASDGPPLAVMDSMSLTALRTAAATAIAAKHLSRERAGNVLICGCGGQAGAQLTALRRVRKLERVIAYDRDAEKARAFAASSRSALGLNVVPATDLPSAVAASDIVVTCTTSQRFFIERDMVRPGTFVAAVGADNENKQEIDPLLLAASTVVTDLTEQCRSIGDLHHAVEQGVMSVGGVHAELGEVLAGLKPGRTQDDEIVIFDSSGTALQDVAAAAAVYRRAIDCGEGMQFSFSR